VGKVCVRLSKLVHNTDILQQRQTRMARTSRDSKVEPPPRGDPGPQGVASEWGREPNFSQPCGKSCVPLRCWRRALEWRGATFCMRVVWSRSKTDGVNLKTPLSVESDGVDLFFIPLRPAHPHGRNIGGPINSTLPSPLVLAIVVCFCC